MKSVVLGVVVKCSAQSTPRLPKEGVGGGGYQTGALRSDTERLDMEKAEKTQKRLKNYGHSELDKMGTLKSIIYVACQDSEKIPSDFV